MPNIVFTKGANTFTLSKGRSFPLDDPAAVNVPVDYSEGGQLYACNKGIEEKFYNITIERGSKTDHDNVENWLLNVAVGPLNTFTYTDEAGASHTVRQLDVKNPLRAVSHEAYSGTIHLREEI
jgi:hypothetical protein